MVERIPHSLEDASARRHDRQVAAERGREQDAAPAAGRAGRTDVLTALARSWITIGLLTLFIFVGAIVWAAQTHSWWVLGAALGVHALGTALIVAASLRRSRAGAPPEDPV